LPKGHTVTGEDSGSTQNDVFTLVDAESIGIGMTKTGKSTLPPAPELTSGLAQHRRALEEQFKTRVAKDSIALILEPGVQVKLRLSFTPPDDKMHSSVLLVRNNLTVIDAMLIQGRGGRGFLKFGNRKPGSATPLAFNIGAKHLKDCDNTRSSKYYQPNFTVKRTFTARNTGELPVQVWGFNINDLPCEGYGFKVLNCEGFELAPNASHKVDIAFTPDFTLSKVQQRLVIQTNLGLVDNSDDMQQRIWKTDEPGKVEYSLVATIPTHLLGQCGCAVPRPSWEPLIYYVVIPLMIAMLIGAIVFSILEADHILKTTLIAMTTSVPSNGHAPVFDKSKVFDLRTLSHTDSKGLTIKNGYANGHTPVENMKLSHPLGSSKKMSSMGDIMANGRKSFSGPTPPKRVSNNLSTNSSTKPKYPKQSDFKSCLNSGDTYTVSDNYASQTQSKNKNKSSNLKVNNNISNNTKASESLSWTRFFSRAVGKKDTVPDNSVYSSVKKSSSYDKEDSAILKQSVGTETDLQFVETKLRRRIKQNNEEETSSTTTESSNTDDLSVSERDTPSSKSSDILSFNQSGKSKKQKSKSKGSNKSKTQNTQSMQSHNDDEGFEISTKVKGLKRCKEMQSGRTFGGDIYQPNTLELPYTLKPIRHREADRDKENHKSPRTSVLKSTESSESVGSGRSSPTPWEDTRQPSLDSLSDIPTPNFTVTHPKPQTQPQPLAPRESSYSAIVLGTDKQKTKVTQIAKVPPEVKRVEKPIPVGVIGQKVTSNNNVGNMNNTCLQGIGSPVTCAPITSNANSSLFTIPDNNFSHQLKDDNYSRSLYSGYGDSSSLSTSPGSNSIHSWDPKTLSAPSGLRPPPGLAQSRDPQHGSVTDDDWSHYNRSNLQMGGSLWPDGHNYNSESMSMGSGNTAPASSLWDSFYNIWSPPFWSSNEGASGQHSQSSPWGTTSLPPQQPTSGINDASGAVSKGLGFDPFSSVTNIWSAPPNQVNDMWAPTSKKDM
ncbi:hypothetical protein SK128_004918, partial [Halocaridina rubra]